MDDLLDKYIKCIDNKSISMTARQLNISQPALSMALQKLETSLGAKLFFRSKLGIIPTKIGELVYIEARQTLSQFNNLILKVNELNNDFDKTLKVGMIDNFGLIFLKKIWEQINNSFPGIKLSFDINNSETLIKLTLEQQIDFGIITQQSNKNIPKDLVQKFLISEDLILVASAKMVRKINTISDIAQCEFYSYNEKSTTNRLIRQYFQINKILINFTVFSTSPGFIVELLKFGKGIAFLPKDFVSQYINEGSLIRILPEITLERKLGLIYHRNVYLNKRQKQIIDIIQNILV